MRRRRSPSGAPRRAAQGPALCRCLTLWSPALDVLSGHRWSPHERNTVDKVQPCCVKVDGECVSMILKPYTYMWVLFPNSLVFLVYNLIAYFQTITDWFNHFFVIDNCRLLRPVFRPVLICLVSQTIQLAPFFYSCLHIQPVLGGIGLLMKAWNMIHDEWWSHRHANRLTPSKINPEGYCFQAIVYTISLEKDTTY